MRPTVTYLKFNCQSLLVIGFRWYSLIDLLIYKLFHETFTEYLPGILDLDITNYIHPFLKVR